MNLKNQKERIIIFVDFGNIHRELLKIRFKVNYGKLKTYLSKEKDLIKFIMYMSVIYPIRPQIIGWIKSLNKKYGIEVKHRYLKELPSGEKFEKGIDVLLTVDMLYYAFNNNYDKALLISGDSDFIPLIEKVQDLGKKVEIWSFKNSISSALIKQVGKSNVNYIDDILNDIEENK